MIFFLVLGSFFLSCSFLHSIFCYTVIHILNIYWKKIYWAPIMCQVPYLTLRTQREVKSLSRVRLFVTPWTITYQAPLSVGFSRQEYWSGLLFPWEDPGDLPNPGIKPRSPAGRRFRALWSEPWGKPKNTMVNNKKKSQHIYITVELLDHRLYIYLVLVYNKKYCKAVVPTTAYNSHFMFLPAFVTVTLLKFKHKISSRWWSRKIWAHPLLMKTAKSQQTAK